MTRKYALTKITAGDYLLPSNDAATIWRIQRYEDGPTYGLDRDIFPRDEEFWAVYKWTGRGLPATRDDLEDWNLWEQHANGLDTRREAIDEAMRLGKEVASA